MNKQELIDKAVEELKGVWRNHKNYWFEKGHMYLYFPEGSFDRMRLCSTDEYHQRARELGWINGYKWGVEYPTNGKKPDLPDDCRVEYWLRDEPEAGTTSVSALGWRRDNVGCYPVASFRIVDERYKPVEQKSITIEGFEFKSLPPKACNLVAVDNETKKVIYLKVHEKGRITLAEDDSTFVHEMSGFTFYAAESYAPTKHKLKRCGLRSPERAPNCRRALNVDDEQDNDGSKIIIIDVGRGISVESDCVLEVGFDANGKQESLSIVSKAIIKQRKAEADKKRVVDAAVKAYDEAREEKGLLLAFTELYDKGFLRMPEDK